MKKLFSKRTLITAVVTYLTVAVAYAIGYFTHSGGGFIDFGPAFSAAIFAMLVSPVVVIAGIIYVVIRRKRGYSIIGYLVLTVGVGIVIICAYAAVDASNSNAYMRQVEKKTQEHNELVDTTIGPSIKAAFPNARIYIDALDASVTEVRLDGYTYHNQPNPNTEAETWRTITQAPAFVHFPYTIRVAYHFMDTEDSFAYLYLNNFNWYYSCLGMSKEGLEEIAHVMHEYLEDYHTDFEIAYSYYLDVRIDKVLESDEEAGEEKLWQAFVEMNGINMELVNIHVLYQQPGAPYNAKGYDIRQNIWSGGY